MHRSVLLREVIEYLAPKEGEAFLDCTINGGGHAKAVAELLGRSGELIGIDEDENALASAEEQLKGSPPRVRLFRGNFRHLDTALREFEIPHVDKILFDLGLSSNQLEVSGRGFSFQRDEPLMMTFSASPAKEAMTAGEIVNRWDEENIATILESYGEEKWGRRIARAIAASRNAKKIETGGELREIIERAVPVRYRKGKIHPATKTFQALRIAVNDEIGALKEALGKAWDAIAAGGRIAVISFHSREDRIVKNFFRDKKKEETGILLAKKPIVPGREELRENPRSRSAKLRVIEKIR